MILLFSLLLLLVCETTSYRRYSKTSNGISIIEVAEPDAASSNYSLQYVSAMWRHGDRSPTKAFPQDKLPFASNWTFGGGGFGQLSPVGMAQHFELGKKIKSRYIFNQSFLSQVYNSHEIYIRATDVNRTLISAFSNLVGMYSQPDNHNRVDVDYPIIEGWPAGFVPIPVHTVPVETDYIGYPDTPCMREDQLRELMMQSEDYLSLMNEKQVKGTFDYLSEVLNATINLDNIWELADGLLIEQLKYSTETIDEWYPWYRRVAKDIEYINNKADLYANGIFDYTVNGLNIGNEIKKKRGGKLRIFTKVIHFIGSLISYVADQLKKKIECLRNSTECRSTFYTNLKYNVLSAHDTTLASFLSVLEATELVLSVGGYPHYSAAILTELYLETSGKFHFKMLYHGDAASDFDVITNFVAGCPVENDYCPVERLYELADKFTPEISMNEWCNVSPDPVTVPASSAFSTNSASTLSESPGMTSTETSVEKTTSFSTTNFIASGSLLALLPLLRW